MYGLSLDTRTGNLSPTRTLLRNSSKNHVLFVPFKFLETFRIFQNFLEIFRINNRFPIFAQYQLIVCYQYQLIVYLRHLEKGPSRSWRIVCVQNKPFVGNKGIYFENKLCANSRMVPFLSEVHK